MYICESIFMFSPYCSTYMVLSLKGINDTNDSYAFASGPGKLLLTQIKIDRGANQVPLRTRIHDNHRQTWAMM